MKEVGRTIFSEPQINVSNLRRAEQTNRATLFSAELPFMNESGQPVISSLVDSLAAIYHTSAADPNGRKIFIRNIAESVPDSAIESLLNETGKVNYWRRSKNEQGKSVSFGTAEFKDIEGVLKAIRLLQRFSIFGQKLEVSYSEKTKNLIGEFIEFKKAELQQQFIIEDLSADEIENRLTEQLCVNDDVVAKKLLLIIQKFEENKERIMKMSINEKGSILATTEEKLGLFKQKYGVLNENQLNEGYSREIENWLKKEELWEQERLIHLEDEKHLHRKKVGLIENELRVKEPDLFPKNERQEEQWRRNKHRRQKILEEDLLAGRPQVHLSMTDLESRKRDNKNKEGSDKDKENEIVEGRKKVKTEVIVLQSTVKEENKERHDKQEHIQPTESSRIGVSMSFSMNGDTLHKSKNDLLVTVIDQRALEQEDETLIFEKQQLVKQETLKKLQKTIEQQKTVEDNLEKVLMRLFKKS